MGDEALKVLSLKNVEQLAKVFHSILLLLIRTVELLQEAREERSVDKSRKKLPVLLVVLVDVGVKVEKLVCCLLIAKRCNYK